MKRIKYLKQINYAELNSQRIYDATVRRIKDWPHKFVWVTNCCGAKYIKEKLKKFHNIHIGKRCFIIANGPSLKNTDLTLLKNEFTIGMNRIYLNKEKMGFLPTYIVVNDIKIQLKQFRDDFNNLNVQRFFNWNARKLFDESETLCYIRSDFKPRFSTDLLKGSWGGHSVTYTCLQLAYYMGFKEVILIGKDHSYAEQGVPGQTIVADGKENNHYIKGYYKPGMVWKIPDYKGEELAYSMAKEAFEKDGRKVLDATVGGKLKVFEKVKYEELF